MKYKDAVPLGASLYFMLPQRHCILVLHATPTTPHPCTSCYPNGTASLYFMLPQRHHTLVPHDTPMTPHLCTSCYPNGTASLYFMLPQRHGILVLHATPTTSHLCTSCYPQRNRIFVLHAIHNDIASLYFKRTRCCWDSNKYKNAVSLG
jgi:hypothetical protein